ncbi:unnamed protein product, partial [Coregonus sp. 'balchen']
RMLDVAVLLLTTLEEMNPNELRRFQSYLTSGQLFGFPLIPEGQLENADKQVTVDHMVKTYAPNRAVEITLRILRWMDQNDLAEKLERDYSGGNIARMYIDLSITITVQWSVQLPGFSPIPERQLENAVRQNIVGQMVKRHDSEGAVEITLRILRRMNLDNLAEKLERDYRHRRGNTRPFVLDIPALLLTTLGKLSEKQLKRFLCFLTSGQLPGFPPIPERQLQNADRQVTVDHMVKTYAPERVVEITLRILRWMDQNDLAEKLLRDHTRGNIARMYINLYITVQCRYCLNLSPRPFVLDIPALLLTTLGKLSEKQLKRFLCFLTSGQLPGFPPIPERQLQNADRQVTVDHMVKTYAPERVVEITLRILRWMDQNDLAEKLLRDHTRGNIARMYINLYITVQWSCLIWKMNQNDLAEKLERDQRSRIVDKDPNCLSIPLLSSPLFPLFPPFPALLLTTLEEFTGEQLKTFQSDLTSGQLADFPPIPERQLENAVRQNTVDHMVKRYDSEGAVEITLWILRRMNLDNLAEKLERDYRHRRGNTRPFVLDIPALLLTTLGKLSEEALMDFQCELRRGLDFPYQFTSHPFNPRSQLENADRQVTVDHMVERFHPERALEVTVDFLRRMNLDDLMEKLKRDHTRAWLLNTLEQLNTNELKTFKNYLTSGQLLGFPPIPESQLENADRRVTVGQMEKRYGLESAVKVTLRILRWMNEHDLTEKLQRDHTGPEKAVQISPEILKKMTWDLSEKLEREEPVAASKREQKPAGAHNANLPSTSSGMWTRSGEKRHHLERQREEHRALGIKRPSMLDVPALLLTTLEEFTEEQLKTFQSNLTSVQLPGFPLIPESQLENTDRQDTVDQMVKRYGPERAVKITLNTMRKMDLGDLAEKLERDHRG